MIYRPNPTLITFILLTLIILSSHKPTKQVNSFNLLLPTSYHPSKGHARQMIITSGQCYDWQSTDSTIIKVKGTHHGLIPSQSAQSTKPNCHSNGIVELVYNGPYPSSIYITATDRASTELISIPVRIRDLQRISIFTKSRIMSLKQFQNLQVYGFDADNNTFTSLQGLRFKWIITEISQINNRNKNIPASIGSIQKIPLKDSSLYMPLDTRKKIQSLENAQSDLLVIRAMHVGKVSVKVRCLQPNYQLISDQIILYIQQKFDIQPALPVHLLAGSKFSYHLLTPSGFNISLPQPYYNIRSSNPSFTVDTVENTLQVTAPRKEATSVLSISDIRTQPAFQRQVQIFSHQPDSIQIIMPNQLIIGRQIPYDIKFYHKGRLLRGVIDPVMLNVMIQQKIDKGSKVSKIFVLDRLNKNIKGYSKGTGIFRVQYNGLASQKIIESITPLKLVSASPSKRIVLPVGQTYQLSVIGGSGLYKYAYSNTPTQASSPASSPSPPSSQQILTVSFNGQLNTRKQGTAYITVTDQKNPSNTLSIRVYIIKMANIYSLQQYKQLNINQQGSLYIGATPRSYTQSAVSGSRVGGDGQVYTQCNDSLLRGLTLSVDRSTAGGSSTSNPLQILNINPINYQTLTQLNALAQANRQLSKLLASRSTASATPNTNIKTSQLYKQYQLYLQSSDIKLSQLERLILDIQSYGLCAKVLVKPVAVYDGEIVIGKTGGKEDAIGAGAGVGSNMKLRVYDRLRTSIPGYISPSGTSSTTTSTATSNKQQVISTPLSSFQWHTVGGPYPWPVPSIGDLQVYMNDIKLDNTKSNTHLYPKITCPARMQSQATYRMRYRNPVSRYLLRPVMQQVQISVLCRLPDAIRLGLPTHSRMHSGDSGDRDMYSKNSQVELSSQFQYTIDDSINSTVYIYPGQCFRISLQPVLRPQANTNNINNRYHRQYIQYYNASNVRYQYRGNIHGKVQQLPQPSPSSSSTTQSTLPRRWNTRIIKYTPSSSSSTFTSTSTQHKTDTLTITAKQLTNPLTRESISFPPSSPLTRTLHIRTLPPLRFSHHPQMIQLPNNPSSQYTLTLDPSIDDPNRYSVICDGNIIRCRKQGNNQIVITPGSIDRTSTSSVRVVDNYVLGSPEIVVTVRVSVIDGLDVSVSRIANANIKDKETITDHKNKQSKGNIKYNKIDKNRLQTNTWIFDGEQFVVYVDVYGYNNSITGTGGRASVNSNRGYKQAITNIDPHIVDVTFNTNTNTGSASSIAPRQLYRYYDDINQLIVIVYHMPKIITPTRNRDSMDSMDIYSSSQPLSIHTLTASLKPNPSSSPSSSGKQLYSNTASLSIYPTITLKGVSYSLPYEQLNIGTTSTSTSTGRSVSKNIDAYTHIMQSCQTTLQVVGGPSTLKTKIVVNAGQGYYYNVVKLSQRRYKVDTIMATAAIDKYKKSTATDRQLQVSINGNEKNLLTILAYYQPQLSSSSSSGNRVQELATVRNLIIVAAIKNIRILGNSVLLVNKHVRYLAQLSQTSNTGTPSPSSTSPSSSTSTSTSSQILKQQCKLRYKWSLSSSTKSSSSSSMLSLIATSDTQKMGINITTNPRLPQLQSQEQQTRGTLKYPYTDINVVVYNQYNRQIGRSSRSVKVVGQDSINILQQASTTGHGDRYGDRYNNKIKIYSDNLLLVPSNSGIKLNRDIVIQEISPCDRQDSRLTVVGDNQIISGSAGSTLGGGHPQLVKITHKNTINTINSNVDVLPSYTSILVTDICTTAIQNIDGAISINPSSSSSSSSSSAVQPSQNVQILSFSIMDCLGRRFQSHNLKNIEYKIYTTDPNIASAHLYDRNNGLISIQGHQLGQTLLILQVIHTGTPHTTLLAKDIMPIYVNVFIIPSKPVMVHIGDIINFSTPTKSTGTGDNRWISADTGIVKINQKTGEAVAYGEGQTYIKYGAMSTRVSVVKLADIVRRTNRIKGSVDDKESTLNANTNTNNAYEYQLIYNGKIYPAPSQAESMYIKNHINWRCQVLGKQGQYLRGVAHLIKSRTDNKHYLSCKIQKIPGTATIQSPIKNIRLRVVGQNKNIGFYLAKQFQQNLQMFMILSQRYINPKDPKYKKSTSPYLLVIQTSQRLDIYQTGGKDAWMLSNEFNGARQIISLDLSQYRSGAGQWRINIVNPRTKQSDHVIISNIVPAQCAEGKDASVYKQVPKDGWKWTDILVIFMAVNFLLILGYQIMQNNSGGGHSKVY